jgi:hypothetical protein
MKSVKDREQIPSLNLAQKQADPVLSKIPDDLWFEYFRTYDEDSFVNFSFNPQRAVLSSFDYRELKIDGKNFNDIVLYDLPKNTTQAFIILTFYYPDIATKTIMDFATNQLGMPNQELFKLCGTICHLDKLKWINEQDPEAFVSMIVKNDYHAFVSAAKHGRLDILKWLKKQAPNELDSMIEAQTYEAFNLAAKGGHLDILKWLKKQTPNNFKYMVESCGYISFYSASKKGHLDILKWLKAKLPEEIDDMIMSNGYEPLLKAYHKGNLDIVNWFLSHPTCFSYAEQHVQEFSGCINPYIDNMLLTLHQESVATLNENPNSVFDIEDPDRAKLCFYMLRNLIRRNDRAYDDEIRFLLGIPSVKRLAHQQLTRGNPNELLRLALSVGNTQAAALLLNIEAVRVMAQQNNYYENEARNGVNVRQLAQDRESSMIGLTAGETKRLEAVINRYQPTIKKEGIGRIMQGLRGHLISIYEQQPACLVIGDKQIILPLNPGKFIQDLKKEDKEEIQNVLKAYYAHPAHTALRYLSKPNPFMHPNASFVNTNPNNRRERWSTFDEYQTEIVLFYLAATDKDMPATGGLTLETRLNHFIQELALIGRAHNWDKTRIRNDKKEEYDDLEGDRPSCYSGVKRRLFQSVIGHPMFDILTKKMINSEIKQWAFDHFQSVLAKTDPHLIEQVLDEYYNDAVNEEEKNAVKHLNVLEYFNISDEKKDGFIKYLTEKYSVQFSDTVSFRLKIENHLALNPEKTGTRYHILKLDELIDFYTYLSEKNKQSKKEPLLASNQSSITFFVPQNVAASDTGSITESNAMEVEKPAQGHKANLKQKSNSEDEDDNRFTKKSKKG